MDNFGGVMFWTTTRTEGFLKKMTKNYKMHTGKEDEKQFIKKMQTGC